jgi:linoleoyl-CoA desaturase
MWNLYGKHYDLTDFIDKHPGGKHILELTKNLEDITALFETYHAFSNMENIQKQLDHYEIPILEKDPPYSFEFSKYRQLVKKVKSIYPDRKTIKSDRSFFLQMVGTFLIFFVSFYFTYVSTIPNYLKYFTQICYSFTESSIQFNILHDGSHYSISKNYKYNQFFSKLGNNINGWNFHAWFYHHVYLHHSFTGLKNDPDTDLYRFNLISYIRSFYQAVIFYTLFPGQQFGQAFLYSMIPITQKYYWSVTKLPNIIYYDFIDIGLISFKLYYLYKAGFLFFIIHAFIVNSLYFINIFPNHSLSETKNENKYNGNDWAKMQIMHSGNFLNNNWWWTRIFGGINFQIEHHLFPNMSNIHYMKVAPIVKEYCQENNIPYVHHDSLYSTFLSFKKTYDFPEISKSVPLKDS